MENSLHAEYTCVDRVIPRLLGDPTGQGSTSQVRKQVQRKGVTGLGHTLVSRGPRRLEEVLTTSVCLSRAGGREVASQIRGDLPVLYRIGWAKAGHSGPHGSGIEAAGARHTPLEGLEARLHLSVHRLTSSLWHRVQIWAPKAQCAKSPLILLYM